MTYSYETKVEIWDDKTGSHLEIGPDRDGLDLVEIRRHDEEGQVVEHIFVYKDEAAMVARALGGGPAIVADGVKRTNDMLRKRVTILEDAIRWALGEGETFRTQRVQEEGPYYWRKELRRRAGM